MKVFFFLLETLFLVEIMVWLSTSTDIYGNKLDLVLLKGQKNREKRYKYDNVLKC